MTAFDKIPTFSQVVVFNDTPVFVQKLGLDRVVSRAECAARNVFRRKCREKETADMVSNEGKGKRIPNSSLPIPDFAEMLTLKIKKYQKGG